MDSSPGNCNKQHHGVPVLWQQEKELNAKSAYLHLFADALISLGVVVTGIIIVYTGWYWLDAVTGIIIMIIILITAWGLLRDSFKMTIDAVPSGIELENIKKIILQIAHVKNKWVTYMYGR